MRRERQEIVEKPEAELADVREVFERFGLTPDESARVAASLSARPDAWVEFMMRFELGLEAPDPGRALKSALTIAGAYVAGGFIGLGGKALILVILVVPFPGAVVDDQSRPERSSMVM